MLANSPAIDAFLTGIVHRVYARPQANGAAWADRGTLVLDGPALVDVVLKSPDQFRKNYWLLSVLGSSRFTANGEEWQCRANLTQASYAQAANSRNRSGIYAVYEAKLSGCESATPSAIQRALLGAAITVFCRSLDCAVDTDALLGFFARVRPILKMAQYLSWVGAGDSERSRLVGQAKAALREYASEVARSPDLVDLMDRFQQEADSLHRFSRHEELLMNFFAGIETSAATLGWAITSLGADRRWQDPILQKVTCAKESHPYLDCFLNETMRYFPAIPFVIREVASAVRLGDLDLPPRRPLLVALIRGPHPRDH